jgi:hypothetical protein
MFSYKWNNNTSVDDDHHCILVYYVNIFLEQQKVQEHCSIILNLNYFLFVVLQLLVFYQNFMFCKIHLMHPNQFCCHHIHER